MASDTTRVTPQILRQLDAFSMHSRRSVLGLRQGSHRSLRRGHGVEFAEYRQYELGDNPRYIDWNLYGRTDKLYIKRYLEEENVSLFVVIDSSASITHPALRIKWEFARTLATYTAYIALSSQDPVTTCVLGYGASPTFWGGRAFAGVNRFLDATAASLPEVPRNINVVSEARRIASRMTFPGICVMISDFLYPTAEVAALLSAFRSRNMEVHAVQVLGPLDIEPGKGTIGATLVDSETGESLPVSLDSESRSVYQARLQSHNKQVREHCLSSQVQFTSTIIEEPISACCIETLNNMALFV